VVGRLDVRHNLILRSAKRVSKDGQHQDWFASFETPRYARLLRMRW
jgi:hypothetical protein